MRLTKVQQEAVRAGSPTVWLGTREAGVMGSTMEALRRKGLAEVQWTSKPYRRLVYRLNDAGNRRRLAMALEEETTVVAHTPIAVRCTFCGWEFHDGTSGGSCGRCGQAVEAA
jgi:hypothetical protein